MWADALKWTGVAKFTVLLMIKLGSIWSFLFHDSLLLNIILLYGWGGFKIWDKFLQQQYIFLKKYSGSAGTAYLEYTEPEEVSLNFYLEQSFRRYLAVYRGD